METALGIKGRIIEKMADIDAGKSRWVAIMIFFGLVFGIALGVFFSPAAELATRNTDSLSLQLNQHSISKVEAVAVPNMYTMTIELRLDHSEGMENNWMYVYLFKDEAPTITSDVEGDLTTYLHNHAYLAEKLDSGRYKIDWVVPWVDSESTTFYLVFYNPINNDNKYQGDLSRIEFTTSYEPTLPLIPITFLMLLIVVPIGIVRIYVLNQKKKELRIQLSLDIENLSDEDKVRLGIPLEPRPAKR